MTSRVFVVDDVADKMRVVNKHDGSDVAGIWIEVEYVRAVERHLCAVLQPPVIEIVGDRPRMPFGTHQNIIYRELALARRVGDLPDEIAHGKSAQKRRLDPTIGREQCARL